MGEPFYVELTKREWFAGMALGGHPDLIKMMRKLPDCSLKGRPKDDNRRIAAGNIARDALRISDALIAELKEPDDG